jgi:cobalamin synthase
VSGLSFALTLSFGLVPVAFLAWARSAGSLGRLSALGLWVMAALVTAIAVSAGVVVYRLAVDAETRPADLWIASFLALVTWCTGVLTLVPGLVFLRLTDDRSLDQYGARFFLEWALIYVLVAAAALALGRWSIRSLAQEPR